MESLEELKKIVAIMPDHTPGVLVGNLLRLESKTGIGYCIGLKKSDAVAVADTILSKGSEFIVHYHKEKECFIVYEGKLQVWVNGMTEEEVQSKPPIILGPGDFYFIDPNVPHNSKALEDTKLIAITVPASAGFPDGPSL